MSTLTAARPSLRPRLGARTRQVVQVWLAVVPTICLLQWLGHDLLAAVPMGLRPAAVASGAVPLVVYAVMPLQLRLVAHLRSRRRGRQRRAAPGRR